MKSQQTNAMKTGASDAPPQFVRRIVCDHRERPSGVPEALKNHPNVELTIHRLRWVPMGATFPIAQLLS